MPLSSSKKTSIEALAPTLQGLQLHVWIGFIVAVLMLLAVIGLGVTQMTRLNKELVQVVVINNVKTRIATQMRDTLRDRAILMHDIVVTADPWTRDEMFQRFLKFGERYAKDRQQLADMLRDPDEIRLMNELDQITRKAQPVMTEVVDAGMSRNNERAVTLLQRRAIPMQGQLVSALDKMSTLQHDANQAALQKTLKAYESTRTLMGLLATVATILAVLVAWLVSRRSLAQVHQTAIEKQKYQTLFETNTDAVFILGDQGFTDCNPATLALFGLAAVKDFLATPIPNLGAPIQSNGMTASAKIISSITHARTVGHSHTDWIGRRNDGSTFHAEIALHAMQLEGKPVIQAIMRDVSERHATEAVREAARQAALNAARIKTEFVATVSHEIRTPMHGILGMSELLLKGGLDSQQREYILMLKSSASGLLDIINDILDFSKIEAGKLVIETVPFSPNALLQSLSNLFQTRALEKNIGLVIRLPDTRPPVLLGDPTRLRQILLNLVDNAIKFTSEGQVEISVSYEADDKRMRCRFAVRDSGIGIPENALAYVFEAFSQADSSTTRRFGGTGLGLTISKQLATLMNGNLQVTSTLGQGSCFTLEVSLMQSTEPLPVVPDQDAPKQLRGRILVVEDHPVNQKVLAYQLTEMGLEHAIANNGLEALRRFEAESFDLIFMDWQMPGMDGLDVTRRIRQIENGTRRIPIIALTANVSSEFREICMDAGADDYLSKPYAESALSAALSRWLKQPVTPPAPVLSAAFPVQPPAASVVTDDVPLDRATLLARYRDNHALVEELVAMFLGTTEASVVAIRTLLTDGNIDACRKEAHALRGAAASVLAKTMQRIAGEMETCMRTPDCEDGQRLLVELEAELQRLQTSLAPAHV
jgi:PAS domain S-box-containing protein